MLRIRLTVFVIIVLSILATMTAMFLPVPEHGFGAQSSVERVTQGLGITFGIASLMLGSAWLFLSSLGGFRTGFRKAYYLISAGIGLQAASTLTYAILQYVGLWGQDLTIVARDLPLDALAAALIYLGVRRFAHILDLPNWKRATGALLIAIAVSLPVLWLVPLQTGLYGPDALLTEQPAILIKLAGSWELLQILFSLTALALLIRIRAAAGPWYKRPLLWFWWALANYALGAAVHLLTDYVVLPAWFKLEYVAIPYTISYALLVVAGYSFAVSTLRSTKTYKSTSMLDVVTFVASLVSKPAEVDPILDDLRALTAAGLSGGEAANTTKLLKIYYQLEDYLVTSERLRAYSRESLRAQLRERFSLPAALDKAEPKPMNNAPLSQ